MSMTTTAEAVAAVATAKNRDELVPLMVEAISVWRFGSDDRDIVPFNKAIRARWSLAALSYVKKQAWKQIEAAR